MAPTIPGWQSLAPGNLPTKHLNLTFSDFNPKIKLAAFDFAGFVDMKNLEAAQFDYYFDYYQDAYSAKKSFSVTGRNYYGPLFFIQISENSIEIEEYCCQDAQCQQTSMKLLYSLACELKLEFEWQAYSWYYDNHQYSNFRTGNEQEIRALFS